MASTPRNYQSGVPMVAGFRVNFRIRVFEREPGLVRLFLRLLAKWAEACNVTVLGFAIMGNHVHLILVQYVDGCHRTVGISAMMRCVLSGLAVKINRRLGREGRIVERTYRSWNLKTVGALIRQMAYVHGQGAWHGTAPLADSWRTHVTLDEADGVVTRIPVLVGVELEDPEERAAALGVLLESIRAEALRLRAVQRATDDGEDLGAQARVDAAHPWQEATERVAGATEGVAALDADVRQVVLVAVEEVSRAKGAAHRAARERVLGYVWPYFERPPRRPAPEVGDVVEVCWAGSGGEGTGPPG